MSPSLTTVGPAGLAGCGGLAGVGLPGTLAAAAARLGGGEAELSRSDASCSGVGPALAGEDTGSSSAPGMKSSSSSPSVRLSLVLAAIETVIDVLGRELVAVPGREAALDAGVPLILLPGSGVAEPDARSPVDLRSVILIFLPLSAMRSFIERKRVSTGGEAAGLWRVRLEGRVTATVVCGFEELEVAAAAAAAAAFLGGRPRLLGPEVVGVGAGADFLGGE